MKKLALLVDGMSDKELDLTGDLTKLKEQKFKIKEGVQYRIRIDFIVQREIVHGLKYVQKTYRKGIPGIYCDKLIVDSNVINCASNLNQFDFCLLMNS